MNIESVVALLNSWPLEMVAGIELIICVISMGGLLRYYGVPGLYCFICILLVVGNIQVLKGGQFSFQNHPIALGTMIFGIIAVTLDIITEYYGKAAAIKGVQLSFFMLVFFTSLMFLTVGLRPLDPKLLIPDELSLYTNHEHIKALFVPMPAILIASLMAYLTSQYVDVFIFNVVKRMTHQRLLWLRTVLSTGISAFIDTCIFSFLAWKLLSPSPVSWNTLFSVYILGTYPLRLMCSFCFTPLIYCARYCLPARENEHLSKL